MAHQAPAASGSAQVRTFRAKSMQAALDLVQQELGPEAVILQTREVAQPRFLRWLRTDDKFEITATTNINVPTPKGMLKNQELAAKLAASANIPLASPPRPQPASPFEHTPGTTRPSPFQGRPIADGGLALDAPSSYPRPQHLSPAHNTAPHSSPATVPPHAQPYPHTPSHTQSHTLPHTQGQAQAHAQGHISSQQPHAYRSPSAVSPGTSPAYSAEPMGTRALAQVRGDMSSSLTPANDTGRYAPTRPEVARPSTPINLATSQLGSMLQQTADPLQISRQLQSIQQMVERLSRVGPARGEEIQSELFHLYTALIDAEVDEDLSRELICRLKDNITPQELAQPLLAKQRLCELVEAEIRCSAPITTTPGRRKVVALVGPTGVGKTTTIAKLAANFRLRNGIRMGLVTVDTYRIAAVEQLRTYAEIIDLPMKVVTSPRDMRRALDELAGLDLVLIDTAGRSPHDELKIQELKSLLQEAQVDEVHLVLSLVSSPRSQQAIAEKFAPAGTTSMILTKLDEAVGMGTLLSVSRKVPLPVSYLTTGQDVPDDIEIANTRRISRLILGEEKLFARRRTDS